MFYHIPFILNKLRTFCTTQISLHLLQWYSLFIKEVNKLKIKALSNCMKVLSGVLTALTVYTVNSACVIVLGQEEEPESLKRLKKY